jgi:hypothetical protein
MMRHHNGGMAFDWEWTMDMDKWHQVVEQTRKDDEAIQQLQLHLGHFILLEHTDHHITLLLLLKISYHRPFFPDGPITSTVDLTGYEDGDLQAPLVVPLSDVVAWEGE